MSGDAPLFLGVYIHRMINYKTSNFFILIFFPTVFLEFETATRIACFNMSTCYSHFVTYFCHEDHRVGNFSGFSSF